MVERIMNEVTTFEGEVLDAVNYYVFDVSMVF